MNDMIPEDVMLDVVDDAAALPLWHRYAILEELHNHNKYYEVSIHLGEGDKSNRYYLVRRYGRRPDTLTGGQRMVEDFLHLNDAISAANKLFMAKLSKGYWEAERPLA